MGKSFILKVSFIFILSCMFILLLYTFEENFTSNEKYIRQISSHDFNDVKISMYLNPNNYRIFTINEIYDIWFTHKPFQIQYIKPDEFKTAFDKMTFIWFYDIMEKLFQILHHQKIPFFLFSGSMVGSFRHHGQIPWDDDTDIFISEQYSNETEQILNSIPGYYVAKHTGLLKFYHLKNSLFVRKYSKKRFGWPMIDIIFYETYNKTHIARKMKPVLYYDKTFIFPLKYRVFWNWILPVPNEIEKIIELIYKTKLSMCQDTQWNHRNQSTLHKHTKTLKCSEFYKYIPFAKRYFTDEKCEEILMKNNTILRKTPCHFL